MIQDGNKLVVFGSQLIGVIIVVFGLLTQQAQLHSPRPPGAKTQISAAPDTSGNLFARLWEDPLENLPTFERAAAAEASSSQSSRSAAASARSDQRGQQPPSLFAQQSAPSSPTTERPAEGPTTATGTRTEKSLTVTPNQSMPIQAPPTILAPVSPAVKYVFLWNVLDARPIPDQTELRLRIRYAVVSAVQAAGYLPYRESVLVPIALDGTNPSTGKELKPIGYFETFQTIDKNASTQRVCLIWTPKDFNLSSNSIDIVTKYIEKADNEHVKQPLQVSQDSVVRILNYGSSDDLAYFLANPKDFGPKTQIEFMRATMPSPTLATLVSALTTVPGERPEPMRPIVTDDLLVQRLAEELRLRIPALNRDLPPISQTTEKADAPDLRPRIVIFTESDTKYSREIVKELDKHLPNTRQEIYTYLRGLDGRSDDSPGNAVSDNAKSDAVGTLLQTGAISETSFGTSQFDYLRRTARSLQGKKSGDRENQIVAVGILGSDVYDKMLVLQAVRPELPSAIFFTTDLDAIYLEREMQPFTRNLVVASAADLDANKTVGDTNWKLPPMRDTYQTVLVNEINNILKSKSSHLGSGHVYEIAPGKSIELDSPNEPATGRDRLLRLLASWWANVAIFLVALGNAFLVLWAISTRRIRTDPLRPWQRHAPMNSLARILIAVEIFVASAGLLFLVSKLSWSQSPLLAGEPLAMGISIWPSIMIRIFAFIVASLLLLIASRSFVISSTTEKINLKKAISGQATLRWRVPFQNQPRTKSFHDFLNELFSAKARIRRILLTSLIYLAFSFWLFRTWPPTVPGRGGSALLIEKLVLAFGVSLYIIHLMFCIDLHRSALKLLSALSQLCPTTRRSQVDQPDVAAALRSVANVTSVIGRTLLYPLTVLTLIILSRLWLFDNWVMTPSLTITFALGAVLLVGASLGLWIQGMRLKNIVLAQTKNESRATEQLKGIQDGAFAAWYNQPIFVAILSAGAVFGSLTVAQPIARLFFASF